MNKTKRKNQIKRVAVVVALLACLTVGGMLAYFTDGDTATNSFTMGKVSIDLIEPAWDSTAAGNLTPLGELAKDPQIKNDGENDAYVFMSVEIPVANVLVAELDGTPADAAADTQLFTYGKDDAEGVDEAWALVGAYVKDGTSHEFGDMVAAADIDDLDLTGAEAVKYVYAYAADDEMTALAKDAYTPSLFDFIKLCNVADDDPANSTFEGASKDVVINAYAIQTQNINESGSHDGANDDGDVAPADVWDVIVNANPDLTAKTPDAAADTGYTAPTADAIV